MRHACARFAKNKATAWTLYCRLEHSCYASELDVFGEMPLISAAYLQSQPASSQSCAPKGQEALRVEFPFSVEKKGLNVSGEFFLLKLIIRLCINIKLSGYLNRTNTTKWSEMQYLAASFDSLWCLGTPLWYLIWWWRLGKETRFVYTLFPL